MLECRNISVSFSGRCVLASCDLTLADGKRIALMGPSGCGKTTLLRVILGLQQPDWGTIYSDAKRPAAVFQEARLLPWCTALENVSLVLPANSQSHETAVNWLRQLGLEKAAALYPSALSGGMQQRVALARALAYKPDLLILDEAFKAMDPDLHKQTLQLVSEVLPDCSMLLATHSEDEAVSLGCHIYRYCEGRFLPDVK